MQIPMRALVALLATAAATPAAAQYGGGQSPQQPTQAQQGSAQPAQGVRPSKQAKKAIVDLQAAVNANDLAAVRAKAAEAQGVAATKEDRYLIGQLQLKAALAANDLALAGTGLDAIDKSGLLDTTKLGQLYSGVGVKAYNAKQFGQAATLFQRATALNPRDSEALGFLAEAQLSQGQKSEALATLQRAIQASAGGGAKAPEALYKRAVGMAYDARLPAAAELARQWVVAYPSADSWRNAIAIYRNLSKADVESTIDLFRLMRAAGALNTPSDLALYVNTLSQQSNFTEAQAVLDQAGSANASNAQVQALVAAVKSKPTVTATELDAAAKTAQSGMALLRIGDRFYGLGQYAKAAEYYRQAGAKGADKNLVNERVGVALAAAGDKAGATAAFNSVTGARADVAKFWLLYLQSRG